MDSDTENFTKYFLPSYFKIIGIVLIIISILILLLASLIKYYFAVFPAAHFVLMFNRLSFVAGLSFVIFSKEKEENEEVNRIRLNALIFTIAVSTFTLLVLEFINLLNNNAPVDAIDFMIIEMCVYYIIFRLKK